jgi:hypothetical protein
MTIDKVKILLFNRGDFSYLAERFARDAAQVWSYTPILGRQPKNRDDQIDAGKKGVEVVDDFEKYKDKADLIVFPDEFSGEICNRMWLEGKRAFGAGLASEYEIDRVLFLKTLKKLGLPVVKTVVTRGLDQAIKALTGQKDKYIKASYNRGDFDTVHFQTLETFMPWFDYQRSKLGIGVSESIELLIQDSFPAVVESGCDRYIVRGKRTPTGTIGYEMKDKWYIYRAVKTIPKILDDIDAKMETVFKGEVKDNKLAKGVYSGAYSTEVRINEKGESRFTDLTARFGSPPGEGICETYKTFTQDVFDVADGKMPKMEYEFEYGAMINLVSSWNEEKEICVQFPKEMENNVKLKHSYKHKDNFYCVPNDSSGYFGVVVAQDKTLKGAINKVNEMARQVVALDLEYQHIPYGKADRIVADGRKFGVLM